MQNVMTMPQVKPSDLSTERDAPASAAPQGEPHRSERDGRSSRSGSRSSSASSASSTAGSAKPHGAFVPLLLGTLALTGWLGFQSWQLVAERQALLAAQASQQPTVDNSAKLRTSLDALAADTQRLAAAGNPNAKILVDELRKRGVTINAGAAATSLPAR